MIRYIYFSHDNGMILANLDINFPKFEHCNLNNKRDIAI